MPWLPSDAEQHNHLATNPQRQKLWATIANSRLVKHGDEAEAIKEANAALDRYVSRKKRK